MKNKIMILKSPKYSLDEKKMFFIGSISEIIFDKKMFKNNFDLKEYIKIYESILNIDPYKDYLYLARPQILARLIKDLFYPRKLRSDEKQQEIVKNAINKHVDFILGKELIDETKEKRINNSSLLSDVIKSREVRGN